MNAATEPIPAENGIPVECAVTSEGDAWRTVWMHDGGRRKEAFGPPYILKDALAAAKALNDRAWGL